MFSSFKERLLAAAARAKKSGALADEEGGGLLLEVEFESDEGSLGRLLGSVRGGRGPRFALGAGLASDENKLSLFLTASQKAELLSVRGSHGYDLSKIIRACISLSLPALKEHPHLIGIMHKKRR